MPQLVIVRNPFDRSKRDVHDLAAQSSVAALVGEYIPAGVDVNVSVNGRMIEREAWPAYELAPRDQMVIVPRVQGGDNALIGAVLMIGLSIVAPGIGTAIAGSMVEAGMITASSAAMWGTIIGAGVGAQGPLVVSKSPQGAL